MADIREDVVQAASLWLLDRAGMAASGSAAVLARGRIRDRVKAAAGRLGNEAGLARTRAARHDEEFVACGPP